MNEIKISLLEIYCLVTQFKNRKENLRANPLQEQTISVLNIMSYKKKKTQTKTET